MTQPQPLTASVRIGAPPADVFPYFIDPALLIRWLGDSADVHPEAGGVFALDMGDTPVRGEYLEVDPPRRVVFTWGVAGRDTLPAGSTTVEVTLTADGSDTIVDLVHRDLPPDAEGGHREGWIEKLDQLVQALAHDDAH